MSALTIGLIIFGASMGLGAVSAYMNQTAQNQALQFNAMMAEQNQRLATIRAEETLKKGKHEELLHRLQVERLKGSQRAAAAAAGVVVGEGSPMDVLYDTELLGEMDAMTIRYNTAMEAWGHKAQAGQYGTEASMYRSQQMSPLLSFGTSLLGGAGQLTSFYMMGKK